MKEICTIGWSDIIRFFISDGWQELLQRGCLQVYGRYQDTYQLKGAVLGTFATIKKAQLRQISHMKWRRIFKMYF